MSLTLIVHIIAYEFMFTLLGIMLYIAGLIDGELSRIQRRRARAREQRARQYNRAFFENPADKPLLQQVVRASGREDRSRGTMTDAQMDQALRVANGEPDPDDDEDDSWRSGQITITEDPRIPRGQALVDDRSMLLNFPTWPPATATATASAVVLPTFTDATVEIPTCGGCEG